MLVELRIRNFAIIDDLHLHFGPGLNILTGETGAGKSIIIDALGMLLGDRATADWVRAGSELAEIEALFQLEHSAVRDELEFALIDNGLDDPDNPQWLTLSREVRRNGRNICRVNGRVVNLQMLGEIAGQLIDVHGQGEHLNLLRPRTHIHLLDRYANLLPLRNALAAEVVTLRKVREELHRLRQDARTIAQRVDMLSFQVEEIFAAQLRAEEETELESERRRLSNAEALLKLAQGAQAILSEGESEMPGALDLISEAVGRLEKLARIDPDMDTLATDGQLLLEQASDLARALQDYADELEFNPERLEEVEERLELIANLKRKYGDTIEQINHFGAAAQEELDALGNWEVKTTELEGQEAQLLHTIGELGTTLSEERRRAGQALAQQVEVELRDLRMERARFGVAVEQRPHAEGAILADGRRVAFDSTGLDQVEFMVSANPGEPLKPMARVASGGETARLMLALKSVLTHADATPTLIFDEIDQGIGGRVGYVVGQKLWMLTGKQPLNGQVAAQLAVQTSAPTKGRKKAGQVAAQHALHTLPTVSHQVLCITHLPQLAAFGDQHFTVNKRVIVDQGEERTSTVVQQLDSIHRIEELMLMLGASTDAGRRSVEEMLGDVARMKQGTG
ncbi:MAG TPA: DNA repair protein RecN [Caldilineaceae bacterium]|nr:DNA repair protein RecN [Caldilineaceae bacterium]